MKNFPNEPLDLPELVRPLRGDLDKHDPLEASKGQNRRPPGKLQLTVPPPGLEEEAIYSSPLAQLLLPGKAPVFPLLHATDRLMPLRAPLFLERPPTLSHPF